VSSNPEVIAMTKWIVRRSLVKGILILGLMAPTLLPAQPPSQELFFFGDSLSDAGNFFTELGEFVVQPFEPIPDAPYAIGGHHFSNGRTWAEQLATLLHSPLSGRPASRSPGLFTNYAVGRSRARAGAPVFPLFDLSTQVNLFFADFGGNAPPEATYVVWSGSNDLRDAFAALALDPSGATTAAIMQDAITAVANNIVALYGAGAREFLVLNLPNIGNCPAVRALGQQDPALPIIAEQLSALSNANLAGALDGLEGLLPGIEILRLDVFVLLNEIVADPQAFGLTNATDSCLRFWVVGGAFCTRPNAYLFWDGAHPTKRGHALLAEAAAELLRGR
jgi:phospholipase/lecithinase/hemolysin